MSKNSLNFNNITIVNIDGRYDNLIEAQNALLKSGIELSGARMLLLSPKKPSNLHHSIVHESIAPLSYFEYSLFIIYDLWQFIPTEFALIVQNDGWVLNGINWVQDFFEYDYIGAPTHYARVKRFEEEKFLNNFNWVQYSNNSNYIVDIVMNGGFSLRSKKLLKTPSDILLPFIENNSRQEDVQLCLFMKNQLEKNGIKFAPLNLAKKFAFEYLSPLLHSDIDLTKILGHHGKLRSFESLNPLKISYSEKEEIVNKVFGEKSIIQLFKEYNYEIKFS